MNPAAVLALIADLYAQLQALAAENAALRADLARDPTGPASETPAA